MSYDGMSKRVKNALKTAIAAIQYDTGSGNEDAFVDVQGSSHGEFDGYPLVRILPGDITTEKASVAENERTVSYVIRTHLPLEDSAKAAEATYDQMYDLTDLIVDTLDVGDYDDILHTIDPTIGTHFLNTRRGDWYVTESEAGIVLMCDVNVEVRYGKDLV